MEQLPAQRAGKLGTFVTHIIIVPILEKTREFFCVRQAAICYNKLVMKKLLLTLLCSVCMLPAAAQPVGQFKLSLWGRLAVASPNNIDEVSGVDFGLGSTTQYMTGLQWDILYAHTTRKLNGAGLALFNQARDVDGVQLGAVQLAEGELWGVQLGAINAATQRMRGVQLGAVNYAWSVRGVQLGVVNYAEYIKGVQLGLLNICPHAWMPAMIFINGRF